MTKITITNPLCPTKGHKVSSATTLTDDTSNPSRELSSSTFHRSDTSRLALCQRMLRYAHNRRSPFGRRGRQDLRRIRLLEGRRRHAIISPSEFSETAARFQPFFSFFIEGRRSESSNIERHLRHDSPERTRLKPFISTRTRWGGGRAVKHIQREKLVRPDICWRV